jgi:NAD(P)-dependent dehydrogenase (short-subunit alcohol dehydrogenase family)
MELTGKTALVTGAARRVGRVIALELARAGLNVIVHYNTSSRESDEVAAEILSMGRQAHTIFGDLEKPESIQAMAEELNRHGMEIDVLVNSAAVYCATPLPEVTVDSWDHIMNVNLRAPFLMCQAFGLKMKERGWGRIINIADCNVRRVYRNFTPYLASKAGVITLTESLALELAPEVTVNAIAPGTVMPPDKADDEFREQAVRRSPLKREGHADDVARMVRHLVEHGKFITGTVVTIDGGATIR